MSLDNSFIAKKDEKFFSILKSKKNQQQPTTAPEVNSPASPVELTEEELADVDGGALKAAPTLEVGM